MKNLDLNAYGVMEMNQQEMRNANGGIGAVVWLIIGLIVSECLDKDAPKDFEEGRQAAHDFWGD
jgi:hypothetical protein